MFYSAVGLIIFIALILKTFVVVPHQNAYIRERLGKFNGTLKAGFHFLVPFIDKVSYRHSLKEQVLDVPPQICITKDNVQVEVDGILYLQVMDAKKASYGIRDYRNASVQLAQTNMRSEIGKLDLDRTFQEREHINDAIILAVDQASDPWGIKVKRYEIKNISPTQTVLHAMEQQMRAEREKRADILHSEGEREAVINLSEGDKQEAINISEGEKLRRINEAEGVARQIELVASATADALKEVASAIQQPGGEDAVQLRISQEYIKRFGAITEAAQTSIVPISLANIQGAFEGFSKIMSGLKTNEKEAE